LVMNTFDAAVALEPDTRPLFHSDRGFQYTSRQFCTRLKKHHMKQSMSRVAHCIDNGPMEGFWGILTASCNAQLAVRNFLIFHCPLDG
jgi:transposase InsO family protein